MPGDTGWPVRLQGHRELMRTMFVLYLGVIVLGLCYLLVIGLRHS